MCCGCASATISGTCGCGSRFPSPFPGSSPTPSSTCSTPPTGAPPARGSGVWRTPGANAPWSGATARRSREPSWPGSRGAVCACTQRCSSVACARASGGRSCGGRTYAARVTDEAAGGGSQGVASNAAWLMAAELVGKVASFVLVVILARGLGPRQYGYFAFTLAFLPLFLHLARWGIDVASLRRIALRRDEFSTTFVNGGALRLGLAVAAAVTGLALAALFVDNRNAYEVAVVVGLALLLDEVAAYLTVAFTAFEQMRFDAGILIANRVVSTALAGAVVAL